MEFDKHLSQFTRKLPKIRGMSRIIEPLRTICSKHYRHRDNKWTTISYFYGDLKINIDRSAYISGLIYWLGYHHYAEVNYLNENLKSDMVFFDLGANQGEFTLVAAKKVFSGQVYAFEPQKYINQLLKNNIALNHLTNVRVLSVALSDKLGKAILYNQESNDKNIGWNEGTFSIYPSEGENIQSHDVDVITLDSFVEAEGIRRLDFMKIDIEGAELPALRGAHNTLKKFKPQIIIEICSPNYQRANYSVEDLFKFLSELGYKFYKVSSPLQEIDLLSLAKKKVVFNVLCISDNQNYRGV